MFSLLLASLIYKGKQRSEKVNVKKAKDNLKSNNLSYTQKRAQL